MAALKYKRLFMRKGEDQLHLLTWLDIGVSFYYPIRLLGIMNCMEAQGWERVIEDFEYQATGVKVGKND